MDTVITATINALEVIRAACLEEIKNSCENKLQQKK